MFCMLEETQVTKEMQGGEELTCRGGGGALLVGLLRWRCCGGDRWLCRGSRTATPGSGATVSSGWERGYCSSLLLCFLAWRRRCLAGRTASLAVLWLRPVAVSWLTDSDSQQWCYCFKRRRDRLLLLPSPLFPFLFFCFSVVSLYPLGLFFNFLPHFKLFLPLPMFRFLSFYSLCPLPFGSFFSSLRFVLSSLRFLLPSNPHSPFFFYLS